MDLSFSGAGFMGCYYFGVVNCWNKYIPRDRVRRVAGASAGSLIAAYYLMDLPLDDCLGEIIALTEDVRARPLGVFDRSNQIVDLLPTKLDRMFPADAHKRVNGRLFVAMTRLRDMKSVIVNEFDSRQDLIDALNCSCFIPVWSGDHVSTYRGEKYIDGGFTNNLPVFDEHTIRVCCFSGNSDIAPLDRASMCPKGSFQGLHFNLNWKNLRRGRRALSPPPPSYIIELLERGFHDTKGFILSNDLIQCDRCFSATQLAFQPIFNKPAPTISPAASPAVSRAGSLRRHKSADSPGSLGIGAGSRPRRGSLAEERKPKSGKRISAKALELGNTARSRSDSEPGLPGQGAPGSDRTKRSFAAKLRERLRRPRDTSHTPDDPQPEVQGVSLAPVIVVDEAPAEPEVGREQTKTARVESVPEIFERSAAPRKVAGDDEDVGLARQTPPEHQQQQQRQVRTWSADSADWSPISNSSSLPNSDGDADSSASEQSSADSALGLKERPVVVAAAKPGEWGPDKAGPSRKTARRSSESPAEKFLSSRRVSAALQEQRELELRSSLLMPDRISFAPSPLPSCPPSPNLNRHCTECIRMRQEARKDAIEASIMRQAQKYGSLKDSGREFSSLKFRLASWLRQFGAPRYSYTLDELEVGAVQGAAAAAVAAAAALQAKRRSSEIPSLS